MHYSMYYRNGQLEEHSLNINKPIIERIRVKTIQSPDSDCLLWTGSIDQNGYPLITISRKTKRVHRVVYEIKNGVIPNGMAILHKCDVRNCINPLHLMIGTQLENIIDMDAKSRRHILRSEDNGNAKLTKKTAIEIYNSSLSQRALASHYKVSKTTIANIKNKRIWLEAISDL
jgi:hypothetical protein